MSAVLTYRPGAERLDRLYDLLPATIRARDQVTGQPLRALLRVVAEQVNVVEDDIARLYENWFIETCDPWAVAYVAALLGTAALAAPAPDRPDKLDSARGRRRLALLLQRRAIANTLAYRRRKGTLAVLEALVRDVGGWAGHAVELRDRTAVFFALNYPHPERGRLVDLRRHDELDRGMGPFATLTRTVDLRGATAGGRGEMTSVGLYVWTMRPARWGKTPACCIDNGADRGVCRPDERRHDYTFSPLGNPVPLVRRLLGPPDLDRPVREAEVPAPIRLRDFRDHKGDFYGPGKSLLIWQGDLAHGPVPLERIVPADLRRPVRLKANEVAVDPESGRIALGLDQNVHQAPPLWVRYYTGVPFDIGGGDYFRSADTPAAACHAFVLTHGFPAQAPKDARPGKTIFETLADALAACAAEKHKHAVIELLDDGPFHLDKPLTVPAEKTIEIRATLGRHPLVLLGSPGEGGHFQPGPKDQTGGRLVLNGLLISDRPLVLRGPLEAVTIRDCTIVPGNGLGACGKPKLKHRPTLILRGLEGSVAIERSIVGAISVQGREGGPTRTGEPPPLTVRDSIVDDAGGPCPALGSPDCAAALVRLLAERSTFFGRVEVHAVELAEDCLFAGRVFVARRRQGCFHFCYVPPASKTPLPRYRCQPDLALASPQCEDKGDDKAVIEAHVRPRFRSRRYGDPEYALLDVDGPAELRRGASDQSEMGAFHDAYFAQRRDYLRAWVDEFTPAGSEVQIIYLPN